ncbi:MAG: hypothetical protein AAB288_04910 [Acidobacteriota bacterium]
MKASDDFKKKIHCGTICSILRASDQPCLFLKEPLHQIRLRMDAATFSVEVVKRNCQFSLPIHATRVFYSANYRRSKIATIEKDGVSDSSVILAVS